MFAFFAVASSSAILPYGTWPYAAAPSWAPAPLAYAHHASPITVAAHVAAPEVVQQVVAPAPHVYAAPAIYAAHAPLAYAHAVPAPVVITKAAAQYTAATRGAVHTAPLPGHAVSQTSLNVAPAPGTW